MIALVQSEMMMQFIEGGLDMANIWPRYDSPQTPNYRGIFNPSSGYATRPSHTAMRLFSEALGGERVTGSSDTAAVPVLAVLSPDEVLKVFLLNKTGSNQACNLTLDRSIDSAGAQVHHTGNINGSTSSLNALTVSAAGSTAGLTVPPYALAVADLRMESTFPHWQGAHFTPAQLADPGLSGPDSTPAGDGWPNLVKYALNLDPWVPARDFPAVDPQGNHWIFSFDRDPLRTDVALIIEESPDLDPAHWEPVAESLAGGPMTARNGATILQDVPGSPDGVRVRSPDHSAAPRMFYRWAARLTTP